VKEGKKDTNEGKTNKKNEGNWVKHGEKQRFKNKRLERMEDEEEITEEKRIEGRHREGERREAREYWRGLGGGSIVSSKEKRRGDLFRIWILGRWRTMEEGGESVDIERYVANWGLAVLYGTGRTRPPSLLYVYLPISNT
jgi:hypothetical protein